MPEAQDKKKALRTVELTALTFLGVSMVLAMFLNAASRYLFKVTFVWVEETIRILFVWSTFIAITTSFFRNEHIGFDGLAKKGKKFNFAYRVVYAASLGVTGGILAYFGFRYNAMTGSVPLPATNLPTSLFMWPGILAGAVWAVLGAYRLIHAFTGRGAGGKA